MDRILIVQQPHPHLEASDLESQELNESPERGAMQRSFIDAFAVGRRHIPDDTAVLGNGLLIGSLVLLKVLSSQRQKTITGIAAIGQQKVGIIDEHASAMKASQPGQHDVENLNGRIDDDANGSLPSFVTREARVLLASDTPVGIRRPVKNTIFMPLNRIDN